MLGVVRDRQPSARALVCGTITEKQAHSCQNKEGGRRGSACKMFISLTCMTHGQNM